MREAWNRLVQVLGEQRQWQRDLARVLEHKLQAMREYNMTGLEALAQSEKRLLDGVEQSEVQRRRVVEELRKMYWGPGSAERVTIKMLARVAPAALRGGLERLAREVKEAAQEVERLNKINGMVSHKVLGHFDQLFQILAEAGRDIGLYGRQGRKTVMEHNRLVDALA